MARWALESGQTHAAASSLPSAGSAKTLDEARQVNITITDKGTIYLNDLFITKSELKEKIDSARMKSPDLKVIVYSDRSARFQDIVSVLDIINGEGIRNISIAARIHEK